MGNRGSKPVCLSRTEKEQRLDGSCWIKSLKKPIQLRYNLMGFERSYQIKIPSTQIINRTFSTLASQMKIDPWFVTGFSDAEGSFIITIYRDEKSKLK